jgi:hypothetical protein
MAASLAELAANSGDMGGILVAALAASPLGAFFLALDGAALAFALARWPPVVFLECRAPKMPFPLPFGVFF